MSRIKSIQNRYPSQISRSITKQIIYCEKGTLKYDPTERNGSTDIKYDPTENNGSTDIEI